MMHIQWPSTQGTLSALSQAAPAAEDCFTCHYTLCRAAVTWALGRGAGAMPIPPRIPPMTSIHPIAPLLAPPTSAFSILLGTIFLPPPLLPLQLFYNSFILCMCVYVCVCKRVCMWCLYTCLFVSLNEHVNKCPNARRGSRFIPKSFLHYSST